MDLLQDEAWVEATVDAIRRGVDREANYRRLFERYYEPVQRFFSRRVFSPDDRLDLTQETFLRVYRGLESYRGDARFGTWVFRIAYNTHLKWLRRAKVRKVEPGAGSPDGETTVVMDGVEPVVVSPRPSPLEGLLDEERRTLLREAIEELPEQMRRTVKLRLYQELSYKEIAAVMKRSIETVKVHIFQARKKLRERIEDLDGIDL